MRHLLAIITLLVGLPLKGAAQVGSAEREVRTFLTDYDRAVSGRDISFLERVLPDDYVMTGASGRKSDRAQVLAFFTRERDKPSYRMLSLKHEHVVVRAVGNMAVVTNEYTSQTTPIDAPNAPPETNKGRHTKVLEKRNGRWMVIAEQDTEQPRDVELMERQLTRAAREYHGLMQRLGSARSNAELEASGDIVALTRVLADEYTSTGEDGTVTNKAQMLARYKLGQTRLTTAELVEHNVFAIDNSAAIETGTVRYVGTNAGLSFDTTQRFTRTWVLWSNGWQIVAQHSSAVSK